MTRSPKDPVPPALPPPPLDADDEERLERIWKALATTPPPAPAKDPWDVSTP